MKRPRLTVVNEKSLAERIADSIVKGSPSAHCPRPADPEVDLANELASAITRAQALTCTQGIVVGRPHYGVSAAAYDDRKITQI